MANMWWSIPKPIEVETEDKERIEQLEAKLYFEQHLTEEEEKELDALIAKAQS